MASSWFFLSTLNYDARSTTHRIYKIWNLTDYSFCNFKLYLSWERPNFTSILERLTKSRVLRIQNCGFGSNMFGLRGGGGGGGAVLDAETLDFKLISQTIWWENLFQPPEMICMSTIRANSFQIFFFSKFLSGNVRYI